MEVLELSKLIKIVSVYPNSQAWLERGFNDTKRIAESRQNLSEKCMAANKILLDVIYQAGGPANVVISQDLIGAHHSARHTYRARLLKEQQEREKDEKLKKQLEQSQARKRKYEEEKGSLDKKVQKVKDDISDLKEKITVHEKNQMKALPTDQTMSRVLRMIHLHPHQLNHQINTNRTLSNANVPISVSLVDCYEMRATSVTWVPVSYIYSGSCAHLHKWDVETS